MNDCEAFIKNAALVTNEFGRWPAFHDAEVLRLSLDRKGRQLILDLKCFEATPERHANRVPPKHVISMLFNGVSDMELADFNHQNVLWALAIERQDEAIAVTFEGVFGLVGHFSCEHAEVTGVTKIEDDHD